jgi:hypothetical protein
VSPTATKIRTTAPGIGAVSPPAGPPASGAGSGSSTLKVECPSGLSTATVPMASAEAVSESCTRYRRRTPPVVMSTQLAVAEWMVNGTGSSSISRSGFGPVRSCPIRTLSPSAVLRVSVSSVERLFRHPRGIAGCGVSAGRARCPLAIAATAACSRWVSGDATDVTSPGSRSRKSVVVSPARNCGLRRIATSRSRLVVTPCSRARDSASDSKAAAPARVGACAITFAIIES